MMNDKYVAATETILNDTPIKNKLTWFHQKYWINFEIDNSKYELLFSFIELKFYLFCTDEDYDILCKDVNYFLNIWYDMFVQLDIDYFRVDLYNNDVDTNNFSWLFRHFTYNKYFLDFINKKGISFTEKKYHKKNQWLIFKKGK